MVYYQKRKKSTLAKIVAIVIFFLALALTFSNVYSVTDYYYTSPGGNGNSNDNKDINHNGDCNIGAEPTSSGFNDPGSTPPGVPEPTTLILLGMGVGSLVVRQLRRK